MRLPSHITPLARHLLAHHHHRSSSSSSSSTIRVSTTYASSLQVLHLSHNQLTDVEAIGRALATNSCLQELYLDYNRIGAASAVHLAEGLRQNNNNDSALQVLQLNYNCLSDEGAAALASALSSSCSSTSSSLRALGLDHNGISDRGALALLAAVETSNVWIHRISLQQNDISSAVLDRVSLYTRANQAGREHIRHEPLPLDRWLLLLERIQHQPDLLYFFLHQIPDLFRYAAIRSDQNSAAQNQL